MSETYPNKDHGNGAGGHDVMDTLEPTQMDVLSRVSDGPIIDALRSVFDPEIPVNIYDLGLIYRIAWIRDRAVEIDMTLTAPGCPVAGQMLKMVEEAVLQVQGVEAVDVRLTFDPPWDSSRMTDEVKLELGLL